MFQARVRVLRSRLSLTYIHSLETPSPSIALSTSVSPSAPTARRRSPYKVFFFFLFHHYTVMAENPSSFLRQRTATHSSFTRQRTATIFLHPAENRNNLPSPGREPQQSSFTRQRTATIFLHPAENRNTLPYPAENRYPFSPLPGEGREPGTMLTYSTQKPPEMMGRDLEKIRRSSLLGNLCLSFCSHSKAEKPLQSLLFLPFSPLHGDGREPVFLPPAENRNSLFLHPAENRNNLPSPGREPQQSSFTRQRTAIIFLHPAENRNNLPSPGREPQHSSLSAENRYPFSPLPGEGREPGTMLTYSTRKPPEMMGRDLEKIRRSSLLGNLFAVQTFPAAISDILVSPTWPRSAVFNLDSSLSVSHCLVMDPEQLSKTLDLLVGQMGVISQQLKENQSDLAELRRQTTERFDNLERGSVWSGVLCMEKQHPQSAVMPYGASLGTKLSYMYTNDKLLLHQHSIGTCRKVGTA
ncbi:hypothetical protein M5K25_001551 [Dendrobium thyrsiflorum]|uniref:Uncharacterized protein n=1 Tax=Dendrobium thyrsiflorum TaxID=117978 RepID=A0ABD0VYB8_DENTH